MNLKRREFLLFLGGVAATVGIGPLNACDSTTRNQPKLSFQPVKAPMPLRGDNISVGKQMAAYARYEVVDDLVLPEGFTYDIVVAWGDRIGDSRCGYNNDYLSFVETSPEEGYLTINFEYISDRTWSQTYQQVIGQSLPFEDIQIAAEKNPTGINALGLSDKDPLKAKIRAICKEALIDQGLGVISLRRLPDGRWERTNSPADRRITGLSGLEDNRYLKATGPAVLIFQKQQGQGYIDGLGDRIIGSFGNCAGGTTPWGTVLSGEENFQSQVPEPIYADGTSSQPATLPFNAKSIDGQGNIFGLAGNKYGWIVEVDPANPNDYGTKHTWLGRYRHEAVGVRVEAGKPLAFYSGCDRQGGHLYKFVSSQPVTNPTDKANSQLLADGMLYAAKFNPDGTGTWIPLNPQTLINPEQPDNIIGNLLWLPKRDRNNQTAGYTKAEKDSQITEFKQQFKTLSDLYTGNTQEQQGAILIDAHYAANAVGATCTARPEDTEIGLNGELYIAFTAGTAGDDGGPDQRIFTGPTGETPYAYGWIMRLAEDTNDPAALTFRWNIVAIGGELAAGGAGFSNPDNLLIDPEGTIWMVTDMGTGAHNKAIPTRLDDTGQPLSNANLIGLFGNNSLWCIPSSGEHAGNAYLFGLGPMECETTGPFFTRDQKTLFLAVQHPGEGNGIRQQAASETREFAMLTTDGQEFTQTRIVPLGSNWPEKTPGAPPKPAVVAIRRLDTQPIRAFETST